MVGDEEARVGYAGTEAGGDGPPAGAKIDAAELRALFGDRVPLEAFRLLFPELDGAPADGRPVEDVRRELREIAARTMPEEPPPAPFMDAAQWAGRFVAEAIEKGRIPQPPPVMAQHRFRTLCMDAMGRQHTDEPATRIAEVLIGGVYSGHVSVRQLPSIVERNPELDPIGRARCLALCQGFMVDYFPRLRG